MFTLHSNNPALLRWQARLARVPRWAWIAFFIGGIIPLAALVVFLLFTFVFFGAIVMGTALLIAATVGIARRLLNRSGTRRLPGNQIIIRSVRVVDP